MTDEEMDKVLQKASGMPPEVEPALLKRIADSINVVAAAGASAAAGRGADRGAGADLRRRGGGGSRSPRISTELKNWVSGGAC